MPLLGDAGHEPLINFLSKDVNAIVTRNEVKAIIVVSAHWEASGAVLVSSSTKPPMIYDYSGFPPETYKYRYPARGGDKELITNIVDLLSKAALGLAVKTEERGFDHGVFVPLMLALPDASLPVISLSLEASFDAGLHYRIGEALAPLRNEGVVILGSGQT